MNKLIKVLAASALVATALVGCGKKDDGGSTTTAAKYVKAGLGVSSTYNEETGQVNSTMAVIGLDAEGKINYIDIDVAQSTPGDAKGELTKTKKERGSEYGMKKASADAGKIENGAEWDEQAKAFEDFCMNKTLADVAGMELEDFHGGKAPKTGTDLASKCTITVDEFLAAVAKAGENAVEVNAAKIGVGEVMSNDVEKKQVNTTIALVATDDAGKVVYSKIDVAQIYKKADGTVITDTKSELKDKYGMKKASADAGKIENGGEWNEQAEAFEAAIKGQTLEQIAGMELEDYHGGKAPKTGTDLASKCTITVDEFLAAIDEAGKALK